MTGRSQQQQRAVAMRVRIVRRKLHGASKAHLGRNPISAQRVNDAERRLRLCQSWIESERLSRIVFDLLHDIASDGVKGGDIREHTGLEGPGARKAWIPHGGLR